MTHKSSLFISLIIVLLLAGCRPTAAPTATAAPTLLDAPPTATNLPPTETPLPPTPIPTDTPLPPSPTPQVVINWSTTASTRTELSFAFPGEWDGSSPLTFGEGEFVKHPDQPLGMTFQIELAGSPETLLEAWGAKDIGIVGIVTFTPDSVASGPDVTIARVQAPTKIARGNGITAQAAYIQRTQDTLEVTWFAPTAQWDDYQATFQDMLASIEIWRTYTNRDIGLQTMYVHDWLEPGPAWDNSGVWFRSADERTGMALFIKDEIADPAQVLGAWSTDRLAPLGFTDCTSGAGDRMDTMSGQWESKMGECLDSGGEKIAYEVSFVPDKDRLIEMITYAPAKTWEKANEIAFTYLLRMMVDIRP
jgi:hypothetical protein